MGATQECGQLLVEPLRGLDLPVEVPGALATSVVDVPGAPARHLACNRRRDLDAVAVGILDSLAPAILDGPSLGPPLLGGGCLLMDSP